MQAENNVAAQAGDEPMRAAFEATCKSKPYRSAWNDGADYAVGHVELAWKAFKAGAEFAAQVSPRATADVERNQAVRDLVRLWDCEVFHPDEYNEEMCRIEAIIRATTKPGA